MKDISEHSVFIQIDEQTEDIDILMMKSVDSETQTKTAKVVDAAVQTEPGNQTGVITEKYSLIPQIFKYVCSQSQVMIHGVQCIHLISVKGLSKITTENCLLFAMCVR